MSKVQTQIHERAAHMPRQDDPSTPCERRTSQISLDYRHLNRPEVVTRAFCVLNRLAGSSLVVVFETICNRNRNTYKFSFVRPSRDDEVCAEGDSNCQNTLKDEYPGESRSVYKSLWNPSPLNKYHCHPLRPPTPSILPMA